MAEVSPRFLLDSDVCIYALERRHPAVAARFERLAAGDAIISVIAYGELCFGLEKSSQRYDSARNLRALTQIVPVAPLPADAAFEYGAIRAELERAGTPIGSNDLWIAAHARAAGLILVTNNEREFRRVPKLKVQNWTAK